jgi:pyruvate/2-oxoglutarate/acetoin dehydrogenase E1 component
MSNHSNYYDRLTDAMTYLASDEKTVFLGQSIKYNGHALYGNLENVPMDRRYELPVMEDFQMGMSIGMGLAGLIPITLYPRFDFLLLSANQLFNHLDNLIYFGGLRSRVIIRVCVGTDVPLDPGNQHKQDYTEPFRSMAKEIDIVALTKAEEVVPAYKEALTRADGRSTLLIEYARLYLDDPNKN